MIHELSATEAAARIRTRELTSEALVRACLARIDARDGEVQAWQHLDREGAMEAARSADRTAPTGRPLHGVPIGVKDIIDTVDMPTGARHFPVRGRAGRHGTQPVSRRCARRAPSCSARR